MSKQKIQQDTNEMIYKGMLGMAELMDFYNVASESIIKKVEDLLKTDKKEDVKIAWGIVKHVLEEKGLFEHLTEDQLNEINMQSFKKLAAMGLIGTTLLAPQSATASTHKHQKTQPEKIAQIANITHNDEVVAATLIGEAGGEGESGMQAIMNVIMNRTKQNYDNAAKACLMPYQFSMWNRHQSDTGSVIQKAKKHPKWNKALELVDKAKKGQLSDITNGADFYFPPKVVTPKWAKKFEKVATVGNHDFYKHGKVNVSRFF
jgi:5'(3')-deoxyribonucleotidase